MGDAHILLDERDTSTATEPLQHFSFGCLGTNTSRKRAFPRDRSKQLAHTRHERIASALLRGRQRYAGEMMIYFL
jgi:hypothetical protein